MDTFQIELCISRLMQNGWLPANFRTRTLLGILPSNWLATGTNFYRPFPHAYIVNTDIHSNPGLHWVVLYLPDFHSVEFFDPFGLQPKSWHPNFSVFFRSLRERNPHLKRFQNDTQIQSIFSNLCGYYCILFLVLRSNNFTFQECLQIFPQNPTLNDQHVNQVMRRLLTTTIRK